MNILLYIYRALLIFLFQGNFTPEQELFNFTIVLLGLFIIVIILVYILLTSKQE